MPEIKTMYPFVDQLIAKSKEWTRAMIHISHGQPKMVDSEMKIEQVGSAIVFTYKNQVVTGTELIADIQIYLRISEITEINYFFVKNIIPAQKIIS